MLSGKPFGYVWRSSVDMLWSEGGTACECGESCDILHVLSFSKERVFPPPASLLRGLFYCPYSSIRSLRIFLSNVIPSTDSCSLRRRVAYD